MKKALLIIVFIGLIFLTVGGIVLAVAIKNDAFKIDYIENTYEVEDEYNSIVVDSTIGDINILVADVTNTTIETKESEDYKFNFIVQDNTLKISEDKKKNKNWLDNLTIVGLAYKVTLTVPSKLYEKIDIKLTTGDVKLDGINADEVLIDGTTGDVKIYNTIANEKMYVDITTGDIKIKASDSKDIHIETTTGDIKGDILSGKSFTTDTTTGDISVPASIDNGEICYLDTTTGDIKITITN